jgi:hypothetical protein
MTPEEREKLIERYAIGPKLLREALERAPEEMRKWRPDPDEFSVHEVIVHCADSETNSHGRIRYLMTEDNATIIGYDPPVWAQAFHYLDHPIEAAMSTVEAVRANTVPILRRATEEQWSHVGTHTEMGPYSAETWLEVYAAHCYDHARQIDAVVEAWQAQQGKPS